MYISMYTHTHTLDKKGDTERYWQSIMPGAMHDRRRSADATWDEDYSDQNHQHMGTTPPSLGNDKRRKCRGFSFLSRSTKDNHWSSQ